MGRTIDEMVADMPEDELIERIALHLARNRELRKATDRSKGKRKKKRRG